MSLQRNSGKRAVVIGGGIAGKLASRVLSDFYEEVILIEKDNHLLKNGIRKGVPQGSQGHVLLKSGEEILENLFPGIKDALIQDGSMKSDFANDICWHHHGTSKVKYKSGLSIIQQSRPFLEWQIQRRLESIPNIHYKFGCKVKNLVMHGSEITGVIAEEIDGQSALMEANLVVDTSGAGSQVPQWLTEMGFQAPKKTEVKVDLFYASMIFKSLSTATFDWHSMLVYPNPPSLSRGGSISPLEDNRFLVTLFGYGTHAPPKDKTAFLQYAKTLAKTDLFEAIINGDTDSHVHIYRFPALRRYHYEKLEEFPAGLLVMGDAFCRVDPVFAQGMSLAALEAQALQNILLKNKNKLKLTMEFHRKISKVIDVPWLIALIEDFRFKHTSGIKPIGLSFLQWYVEKVVFASSHNADVYGQFMKVLHLKAHPVSLFSPRILKLSLFSNRKSIL